jgi:hypothetical protein
MRPAIMTASHVTCTGVLRMKPTYYGPGWHHCYPHAGGSDSVGHLYTSAASIQVLCSMELQVNVSLAGAISLAPVSQEAYPYAYYESQPGSSWITAWDPQISIGQAPCTKFNAKGRYHLRFGGVVSLRYCASLAIPYPSTCHHPWRRCTS